jgi:hypothetical protein
MRRSEGLAVHETQSVRILHRIYDRSKGDWLIIAGIAIPTFGIEPDDPFFPKCDRAGQGGHSIGALPPESSRDYRYDESRIPTDAFHRV